MASGISYNDLAIKYNISTHEIVRCWVIKYNQGIEIKDYNPKSEVYAMKARKTTFEERLEIVNYVLGHDNYYKGAADKYSVPYASAYQWVSKYNKYGESKLSDKRGRPSTVKPIKELTSEEKQAIEIERLKRELERKDMIIEVLKKHQNSGTNGKKFSLIRQEDKYETIKYFNENKGYSIDFLCKTLDLPKSSYYKWMNRKIPKKELQDEELAALIIDYNDTFEGVLGYRRMIFYINYFNHTHYSEGYIHRLMSTLHIKARIRLKKSNRIIIKPEQVGENILARNFTAEYPNQKWCTDVTEF